MNPKDAIKAVQEEIAAFRVDPAMDAAVVIEKIEIHCSNVLEDDAAAAE